MKQVTKALMAGILVLGLGQASLAAEPRSEPSYDLLFRDGTLDAVPRAEKITYQRQVEITAAPDMAAHNTGVIELSFTGGAPETVRLQFFQDEKYRKLGDFPASVGNPMIMYFMESIIRDMATTTGGSPFYIRNRLKNALITPADIEDSSIDVNGTSLPAQHVILRPFEGDPNAERMDGFADLEMHVIMSEDIPGWYHSLRAEVPVTADQAQIYSNVISFQMAGAVQ
ncbi:MAG: hypothetical protein ACPGNV_15540 [Mangrovicoccus sp.]